MKKIEVKQASHITETFIDFLVELPLFDELKEKELNIVANCMTFFELEKEEILFQEGDEGDCIYFVLDGIIDVIKESSPGSSVVIASLPRGRSIGEMSVIDNYPRSATAKARTQSSFLTLTQESFDVIIDGYPKIGTKLLKAILRLLSQNLRKTSSRLADYMLPIT